MKSCALPQLMLDAFDFVLPSKDFFRRKCISCKCGARIKKNNYAVHYVPSLVHNNGWYFSKGSNHDLVFSVVIYHIQDNIQ